MAVTHLSHRKVMIVAPAGIWRDALASLLRAQPNLAIEAIVDTLVAARDLLAAASVDVIIIDNSIGDTDLRAFLCWLSEEHPRVRAVVAVDTQLQQAHYLAAGAHATLQKGRLNDAQLRVTVGEEG